MGIRDTIERAKLKRALAVDRKRRESRQKTAFESDKEKDRIERLEEKRRLQKLKERRRILERKTGSGVRGFVARTESARAKVASRRVSFSRRASKQRLAAFEVAGLAPPPRARRVIKKRKRRKRKPKPQGFMLRLR